MHIGPTSHTYVRAFIIGFVQKTDITKDDKQPIRLWPDFIGYHIVVYFTNFTWRPEYVITNTSWTDIHQYSKINMWGIPLIFTDHHTVALITPKYLQNIAIGHKVQGNGLLVAVWNQFVLRENKNAPV